MSDLRQEPETGQEHESQEIESLKAERDRFQRERDEAIAVIRGCEPDSQQDEGLLALGKRLIELEEKRDRLEAELEQAQAKSTGVQEALSLLHREHLENCPICCLNSRCDRGKWFCNLLRGNPGQALLDRLEKQRSELVVANDQLAKDEGLFQATDGLIAALKAHNEKLERGLRAIAGADTDKDGEYIPQSGAILKLIAQQALAACEPATVHWSVPPLEGGYDEALRKIAKEPKEGK